MQAAATQRVMFVIKPGPGIFLIGKRRKTLVGIKMIVTPFPCAPAVFQLVQAAGDFPLVFMWQFAASPFGKGLCFMKGDAVQYIITMQLIAAAQSDTIPVTGSILAPVLWRCNFFLL